MIKMKKVVLVVAILGLTSLLFAGQPESLKKKATAGLIEDGLVDDFDVGVDGTKGLWFGGYNGKFSDFNFGYGAYVGKIWLSVFDQLSESTFSSTKGSEKTIDEIAEDTVNIDKTKTTSKDYKKKDNEHFTNELNVAFAVNKVGAQLYWNVNDITPNPAQDDYTETKGGVITTQNAKKYIAFNEVGANFNGIGIRNIGDAKFYFDLKQLDFLMVSNKGETNITTEADPNADPDEDPVTSFTNSNLSYKDVAYKPQAIVELGFTLPAIGKSVSTVSFNEKFNCEIPGKKFNNSKSVTVDTSDINKTVTTTKTENIDDDTVFKWNNTLTPKIKTTYDVGENLVIKTALEAAVSVENGCTGLNSRRSSVTETVTTDNVNAKTTKTRSETSGYNENTFNEYLETNISTSVTPKISCGLSYALKPNKCYVNIGALWQAGTFNWKSTTTTMQTGTKATKVTKTDEFGQETVTQNDVIIISADTPAEDTNPAKESVEYTFTSSDPVADTLYVGTTWMLNENASIDLLYEAGFNTFSLFGSGGMFTSSLSATFTIKF